MDDKKDFKAVKVNIKSGTKNEQTLSRSMLYSGINIFGQLTQMYMSNKESGEISQMSASQQAASAEQNSDMMSLPSEVLMIFKRVQKKDPITKCKAFKEMDEYLENTEKYSEDHQNLLTFFLYHYCRILVNEYDKQVREAAQVTLGNFIKKGVKRLGPHMGKIFPIWFCSFYDSSPEVSQLGRQNFKAAFKENGGRVFKISFKYFLHFADEHLKQNEDQLAENSSDITKKLKEENYDRIISSIFQALAESFEFIKDWEEEDKAYYIKKLLSYLSLKIENDESTKKSKGAALWNLATKQYRSKVRASCLLFIAKFLQNVPKEFTEPHIEQLGPLIFDMISEDNSIIQGTLWKEAFFTVGKEFPEVWQKINIKKFIQGLMTCIKNGAYGATYALYPNLVKFVSIFPIFHVVDIDASLKFSEKDRAKFLTQFYQHLFAGLKNDEAPNFHRELTGAYFETINFWLIKRYNSQAKDIEFLDAQLKMVLELPMNDFIAKYEKPASKVLKQRNIRSTIPERYARLFKDLLEREGQENIIQKVIEVIYESVLERLDTMNSLRFVKKVLKFGKNHEKFCQEIIQNLQVKLVKDIFDNQLTKEIQEVGRKTLVQVEQKTQNLQLLIQALIGSKINCFIDLQKILDLVINLDNTEERAKKMLDEADMQTLRKIKEHLVLISLMFLNCEDYDKKCSESFFNYTLIESKLIQPQLKKLILLPNVFINSKSPIDASCYFGNINKDIFMKYIIEDLMKSKAKDSWETLKHLLKNDIFTDAELNNLAKALLERIDSSQSSQDKIHLLKASENIMVKDNEYSQKFQQKLIAIVIDENIEGSWQLFDHILASGNQQFLQNCKDSFKSKLSKVIQEHQQFDQVDKLTTLIKDFIQLVDSTKRQEIIQYILITEENFQSCEKSCLPMKVFRDMFLQGGVSFDVQGLFLKDEFVWLATILLNINNMSSLNNFPDLKKQLIVFLDTEVMPALIINGSKDLFFSLISNLKSKISATNDSCLTTLENLLHNIVSPSEDYGLIDPILKTDDFKEIFTLLSRETAQQFLNKNYDKLSQTDIKVLSLVLKHIAYYILDEPEVLQLNKFVKKNLHVDILCKTEDMKEIIYSLSVYLAIYPQFKSDYDSEQQELLIQWILGNFSMNFAGNESIEKVFQINVILEFLARMMDQHGMNRFIEIITFIPKDLIKKAASEESQTEEKKEEDQGEKGNDPKVEEQFESSLETLILLIIKIAEDVKLQPITYIHFLTLIGKVISNPKIILERQFLIDEVLEMARSKVEEFDKKIHSFLQQEQQEEILHLEDKMLQAFADTLIIFTPYINNETSESCLYTLLSSGFEPLQKASYFMLNYLYENFVPKVLFSKNLDIDKEYENLQNIASHSEEQKEEQKQISQEQDETQEEVAKDKIEFRNIPEVLINLIENPPSIEEDHQQSTMESLVYGEIKEGCLSKKAFGYLLAWSSLLKKIDNGGIKAQLEDNEEYSNVLTTINQFLEQNKHIYQMLLVIIVAYLPKTKKPSQCDISDFDPAQVNLDDIKNTKLMALFTLVGFMKSFPSMARKYYQDCDKQLLEIVLPYIKTVVSPAILDNEISKIELSQINLSKTAQGEGLTFQLFKSTKEILAEYTKGEVSMQLKIQIPADYPLKSVIVEVGQQLKITERQKHKWVLAIKNLLQLRNGDIISAVLLWKNNIDKEIEGVEECFICYCVLHPTDKSLPRMPCKNCKNKFHVACIRKWFRTSNKSNCPLCQAYFF